MNGYVGMLLRELLEPLSQDLLEVGNGCGRFVCNLQLDLPNTFFVLRCTYTNANDGPVSVLSED